MVRVYLSVGTNVRREYYLTSALDALSAAFGELCLSSVYESEAIGFAGDPFYNMVVGIDTGLDLKTLAEHLRAIEYANDRRRDCPKFSAKTLDIDILTYGDLVGVEGSVTLPRDEILTNAFVLLPLSEVAPHTCHPILNKSYAELWSEYHHDQKLWSVPFIWKHSNLSADCIHSA